MSSSPLMQSQVRVVGALGIAQTLAWGSSYYLPAILANPMAAELGLSTAWIFTAFSAGLLISATLGPMSGRLIDAYGGRRVLPVSNVIFALGLSLQGCAGDAAWLFGSWLVLGVAMSCGLYESAFATVARIYGQKARSAITGITLFAGFASTIAWPLTAWLEVSFGWRFACFAWAAAHLLICAPLNFLVPRGERIVGATSEATEPLQERGRTWIMVALGFVFTATWFSSTAMAAHLPRLLQEAGATLPAAIAAAALVGPAQVAGRMVEFGLMRRLHPLLSARVASIAHPTAAGVLLIVGAPAAPLFAIVHGAGNGVMTIANGTLPLYFFGAGGYGQRQGLLMMPAKILQAAAPFLFDLLLSRFGTAALGATAALCIASCLVLCALPATGPAQAER